MNKMNYKFTINYLREFYYTFLFRSSTLFG
jgi:hypothetical protein